MLSEQLPSIRPEQTYALDEKTDFVSRTETLQDLFFDIAAYGLTGAEADYALYRWFEKNAKKMYIELFREYGATPANNKNLADFSIYGVDYYFSVLRRIGDWSTYRLNLDIYDDKNKYIYWLYDNGFGLSGSNCIFYIVESTHNDEKSRITEENWLIANATTAEKNIANFMSRYEFPNAITVRGNDVCSDIIVARKW